MNQVGQGLLSAALRHIRDAEHLAAQGAHESLDQAFHLAGYGPECARKAVLSDRTFDRAIGHGVQRAAELALRFALAADPAARRYDLEDWSSAYPELANWSEQSRYERTGTRAVTVVNPLLAEARSITDRITYSLWADGRLAGGFSW
ncbi:MAG: hypothetical protein FJ265_04755 [Planctomycetes bacterium]|nr:hypothetical protein [Planctomycetota bacterium]